MAHVAKYTKCQLGGLTRHFERAKNKDNKYIKFGNQDIDINRTHLNYNLAENKNQLEFINQRCSDVKCLNRKDVNVMCSWVITLPKDLKDINDEKKFFEECYKFLNNRYGEQNVISAYVHKDETNPHIHYAFVPVARDKKLGIEKVSAKEILNKRDLQTFHSDLDKHMEQIFSRNIGILNDSTREGNKSVKELKRGTAQEEYSNMLLKVSNLAQEKLKLKEGINTLSEEKNQLQGEIEVLEKKLNNKVDKLRVINKDIQNKNKTFIEVSNAVSKAQKKVLEYKSTLEPLRAEYRAKKAYISSVKKSSNISMMYPSYVKISKGIFGNQENVIVPKQKWEERWIARNDLDNIKEMRMSLEQSIKEFKNSQLGKNYENMIMEIERLNVLVEYLETKNKELKTQLTDKSNNLNVEMKERKEDKEKIISKVKRVVSRLSEEESNKFNEEWLKDTEELNNINKNLKREKKKSRQKNYGER